MDEAGRHGDDPRELVEHAADADRYTDRRKPRDVPSDPPLLGGHAVRDEEDVGRRRTDARDRVGVTGGIRRAGVRAGHDEPGMSPPQLGRGALGDAGRGT